MENVQFSLSDINYLLFIIPGFVVVWSYRFFAKPKPIGEFEYAGLSFIWGIFLVALVGLFSKFIPSFSKQVANPYGATLLFSFFGLILGWLGSFVATWKWFKKVVNLFRPKYFGK